MLQLLSFLNVIFIKLANTLELLLEGRLELSGHPWDLCQITSVTLIVIILHLFGNWKLFKVSLRCAILVKRIAHPKYNRLTSRVS